MEDSDKQILVYEAEYDRLRKVFRAASDYDEGLQWPEFEQASGGIEKLKATMLNAVRDLERWYGNFESDY